ncbi:uracil permease [Salmonella enterica subsp. enterica]|uniref:Uracil permease n=1 Tax=Salmonella enterica I TaxID=59201 RepID=A0A447N6G3_SALET|nr:uracil permease [Salmonella enterica subsp. enterica]
MIGVLAGYALSFALGVVDTTPIAQAHWFALPTFYTPRFEWFAILDDSARGVGRDCRACRSSGGDGEYRQKGFSARSRFAPLDVR